jgi:hypothetical protein
MHDLALGWSLRMEFACPAFPANTSQMGIARRFGNGAAGFITAARPVCHNLVRFWI